MERVTRDKGFTLLEMLVVLGITTLLMALVIPSVLMVRESSNRLRCVNNLRQIGTACSLYEETHGVFPPAFFRIALYSGWDAFHGWPTNHGWPSLLLPYMEDSGLHEQINFQHPCNHRVSSSLWFPPVNTTAYSYQPNWLLCPSDGLDGSQMDTGFYNVSLGLQVYGATNYKPNVSTWWASGTRNDGGVPISHETWTTRRGNLREYVKGIEKVAFFSENLQGKWNRRRYSFINDRIFLISFDLEDIGSGRGFGSVSLASKVCEESGKPYEWDHSGRGWGMWDLFGNKVYNHVSTPNKKSCSSRFDLDKAVLPPNSNHSAGVNVLFGGGGVKFISDNVDAKIWLKQGLYREL